MSSRPTDRPTAKKVLWFCWKLAQMKFRENKFRIIWNIGAFHWKIRKKSDSKLENSENFELEIKIFSNFSTKISNVPKYGKFIFSEMYLRKFWARSDKFGTQDFYRGFLNEKFYKGFPFKMNQIFKRDFPLKFTRDFL